MTRREAPKWAKLLAHDTHKIECDGYSIVVTRHMDYPKDAWVLRCDRHMRVLTSRDIDAAKDEALRIVRNRFQGIVTAIDQVMEATEAKACAKARKA